MRFSYLIYPEAEERLQQHGLVERIDRCLKDEEEINLFSHRSPHDIQQDVEYIGEKGYFKFLSDEDKKRIQSLFNNPEKFSWKTQRGEQVVEETAEEGDVLILLGYEASFILSPEEMQNPEAFGFSSSFELNGTIGALMQERNKLRFSDRTGIKWRTTKDGKTLENEITGDHNSDLRIHQDDITPYSTTDPLGNEIHYRPEFRVDRNCVAGYHSVECSLLVTLLKYIDQLGLEPELLKDNGEPLFLWLQSIKDQRLDLTFATTTEHFTGTSPNNFLTMSSFDFSITQLDENFSTEQYTDHGIISPGEWVYGIYIGPNKELVFVSEKRQEKKQQKLPDIAAIYQPEEVDDFLKGLFYQALRGYGRTHISELTSLLDYKFSGKYDERRISVKELK